MFRIRLVFASVIFVTGTLTVTLQEAFTPLPSFAVAVIVAVPFAMAFTLPFASTVAIFVLLLFQVTALLLALEGRTDLTLSAVFTPLFRIRLVFASVIFVTGTLTVTLQEAFTPLPSFAVAVIVAVPFATAFTLPCASTVAIFVLLLFQVTALLLASEGTIDLTFSAVFAPLFRIRLVFASVIFVTGTLTVTLQEAFTPLPSFAVAVIVAVPFATAFTLPCASTVAIFVLLLFQVTALLLASEGTTDLTFRAVFAPLFRIRLVFASVIFVTGTVTVTLQLAWAPPPSSAVAVIIAVPFATPFTVPSVSTVATVVSLLFQVTLLLVGSSGQYSLIFKAAVLPLLTVMAVWERAISFTSAITVTLQVSLISG